MPFPAKDRVIQKNNLLTFYMHIIVDENRELQRLVYLKSTDSEGYLKR